MDSYILNNIISQICYFIVFLFIAGFIISLLNKWFYRITNYNRIVLYSTSFIGTPIHELSHALMCIIFMHRIHEIKLFQVNDNNGVLGYVNHSYNKKNLLAVLGNFFIGIAPIICGSLLLFFLMKYFMPELYYEMALYAEDLAILQGRELSSSIFLYLLATAWGSIQCISSAFSFTLEWFIFIIIGMCIALHMNLSSADLKSALVALPFVILIIMVLNIILGNFAIGIYELYLNFMNLVGGFILINLIFSIIISIGYILIACIIKLIIRIIKR